MYNTRKRYTHDKNQESHTEHKDRHDMPREEMLALTWFEDEMNHYSDNQLDRR